MADVADDATMRYFCRNADTVKVEAERFPLLADVIGESFGTPEHLFMVTVHDIRVARLNDQARDRSIAGDVNGSQRLAKAKAESMAYNASHPRNGSRSIAAALRRAHLPTTPHPAPAHAVTGEMHTGARLNKVIDAQRRTARRPITETSTI